MKWREYFLEQIGGLPSDQFLLDRSLSDVIKPLVHSRMNSEAARIQLELSATPSYEPRTWRGVRIALANHAMEAFAGSELWTVETARFLQDAGANVIIYSPKIGSVSYQATNCGIKVTPSIGEVCEFSPDILHVNHYQSTISLVEILYSKSKIINMVHGLLPKPGMPGDLHIDKYLSVSVAAKLKVHLVTDRTWDEIIILPNYFDECRFGSVGSAAGRRRALIHSSRTRPVQREALRGFLETHGFEMEHIGRGGGVPTSKPEEWLPQFDIVFAVGRSAIEALASGAHVILWDAGILGCAVTSENFWHCVAANFALSGNAMPWCSVAHPDAKAWIDNEIMKCSEQNRLDTTELTRSHLTLERLGQHLIKTYSELLNTTR